MFYVVFLFFFSVFLLLEVVGFWCDVGFIFWFVRNVDFDWCFCECFIYFYEFVCVNVLCLVVDEVEDYFGLLLLFDQYLCNVFCGILCMYVSDV